MGLETKKNQVIAQIDRLQTNLWQISKSLYQHPEIAFQEFKSAALLTDMLSEAGFSVERGIGGLETAFRAIYKKNGGSGPTVAFLAEYDALPEIGHACGHNLIAAAAVGAGMGMVPMLEQLPGQIMVIGTPAEEGGGGKRILVDAGVFNGIDAAMMFHPSSKNLVTRGSLASMRLKVEFFGKPAHAAAYPQGGINALDAMLLMFNGINALRQHFEPKDRVAGIILQGGDAPNIIPAHTAAEFSVRGKTSNRREEVLKKVLACAQAAAAATGCRLEYDPQPGYAEIIPNPTIANLLTDNLNKLGREVSLPLPDEPMGSTDMGNVSQVVPSLHPYIETVPPEVGGHTIEFRETCVSPSGKKAMLDGAKAMAMTAVDLLENPELVSRAWAELKDYRATV